MESPKHEAMPLTLFCVGKALFLSTRPRQLIKNLIIFFALFFSVKEVWDLSDTETALTALGKSTVAFVLFSILTGAVYLINDIFDAKKDRIHPRKRMRPIAAGHLPYTVAWPSAVGLLLVSLGLSFLMEPLFGWIELAYLILMIAYALFLKRIVFVDVFLISVGFVLRAIAGAVVLEVPVSPWLYTCAGLGALLVVLGKRRGELFTAGDSAFRQRETLGWYTIKLIDRLMAVLAISALLAYTLYTVTAPNLPDNHTMMFTVPFVFYGLIRYIHLVHNKGLGESPEEMFLSDVPLVSSIIMWLVVSSTTLLIFR